MTKPLKTLIQYCCPQHTLTRFIGWLAECRWQWFKNWAIKRLIRKYHVNLSEAASENLADYPNFNSFFTRQLKPAVRPIVEAPDLLACPADGSISQIGRIEKNTILQAKNFNYSTLSLLGGSAALASQFEDGNFATIYLAPKDYHRVHMPITGKLIQTIYVPGQLFSVNTLTAETVPNLFARNERLICLFQTAVGTVAIILVGAMLVSGIQTVWSPSLYLKSDKIVMEHYDAEGMTLERGAELGLFRMGSTVILLFPKNAIAWRKSLQENVVVKFGEEIATLL